MNCRRQRISIHALREEGDLAGGRDDRAAGKFLSTPSARRATMLVRVKAVGVVQFLSTPSARRATEPVEANYPVEQISIHALREEGDRCGIKSIVE